MNQNIKSECCNAEIKGEWENDRSCYFYCSKCKKICDVGIKKEEGEKEHEHHFEFDISKIEQNDCYGLKRTVYAICVKCGLVKRQEL